MLRRGLSMFKEPLKVLLQKKMLWEPVAAGYKSGEWQVRVNCEFPETSLYTLFKHENPKPIGHFDDWPENWDKNSLSRAKKSLPNNN